MRTRFYPSYLLGSNQVEKLANYFPKPPVKRYSTEGSKSNWPLPFLLEKNGTFYQFQYESLSPATGTKHSYSLNSLLIAWDL